MKAWYKSKTIWSGIVAALAGLLGLLGYTITPADQATLSELLLSIGSAFGGIGAIYGRVKARDDIGDGKSAGVTGVVLAAALSTGLVGFSQDADAQEGGYLEWERPTLRENGEPLTVEEIGGFEIRYQSDGATYTVLIPDGTAIGYNLEGLAPPVDPGETTFQVAVYDTNGLYSEFVDIEARIPGPAPQSVTGAMYSPPSIPGPSDLCAQSMQCREDMLSARYGQD